MTMIARILVISVFWCSCVHAATRVALVTTCGGEASADVLALTEAQLSQQPDIVLVERREVERVLEELKLVQCGPSQSQQAVATGKLLGVEVFVSLETIPKEKQALGLVVFDAASGMRLSDSVLPEGGPEAIAGTVARQVWTSCEKRHQLPASLRPVCILSVRNADLPFELDSWCQSVGIMLRRRLVQSSSLTVLERERLEHVNKEQSLPTDAAPTNPVAAAVMVELEVGRGAAGKGIRATAFLSDGGGSKLGQTAPVTVDNENAADLSERLLAELVKVLHVAPVPAIADRDREADRFLRESDYLTRTGEEVAGLHAAEAAYALSPTNTAAEGRLIGCLNQYAGRHFGTQPEQFKISLNVARRTLDMLRTIYLRPDPPLAPVDSWRGPSPWIGTGLLPQFIRAANNQDAETQRKALEYRQLLLDLHMEVICRRAGVGVTSGRHFSNRACPLINFQADLEHVTLSGDEWTADTIACLKAWLAMAEQFPLMSGDLYRMSTRLMNRLCYQVRGPATLHHPHLTGWKLQPEHYRQFDAVFQQMQQHPDPVVQCYGVIGQLCVKLREQPYPASESLHQYDVAKALIRDKIATVKREPLLHYRSLLYGAMLDLIDTLSDHELRKREYTELFEFMLQRKEVEYWATRMVTDANTYTYRQYDSPVAWSWPDVFPHDPNQFRPDEYPLLLQNGNRVLELYRSKEGIDVDAKFWSFNTKAFDRELAWVQRNLPHSALAEPRSGSAWDSTKLLFDTGEQRHGEVVALVSDSNVVYAVTGGSQLQFVRIPLNGENPAYLGEGVAESSPVKAVAVADGYLFVGTTNGIYIVSIATGQTQRIGTAQGLPSESVQTVAAVDGILYAGLINRWREGCLVAYDLKTTACKILISNRRQEATNPLDKGLADITGLFADSARHRVVFTVSAGPFDSETPLMGIWQIQSGTDRPTQLVPMYGSPGWTGRADANTILIQHRGTWDGQSPLWGVLKFDLATDHPKVLYAANAHAVGPQFPTQQTVPAIPWVATPPYLIAQNWIWFTEKPRKGRVSSDGNVIEYFQQTTPPAETWRNLLSVGDDRHVIVTDATRVWLLTLPEKFTKETP